MHSSYRTGQSQGIGRRIMRGHTNRSAAISRPVTVRTTFWPCSLIFADPFSIDERSSLSPRISSIPISLQIVKTFTKKIYLNKGEDGGEKMAYSHRAFSRRIEGVDEGENVIRLPFFRGIPT